MTNQPRPDLEWILNELVEFPAARHAVVLSADGLCMVRSKKTDRDQADRIAATASGLQSLSGAAAGFVGEDAGPWQQSMVQYRGGMLFLVAAGAGSHLVASAGGDVDITAFADAMAKTIQRLGTEFAAGPRQAQGARG
ncbi:roadblock/LC7 domain-containing protein [Streptomyces sp. NPDC048717]|uniref:roadblock/LC7 domain-containing protein n=1 Tax=Streptomyces sp. NPDC048717 TaxID=3154928 RepID=UPI00343B4AEC